MPNLRSFLKRHRAFTLVELLIVIIVLAVLAGIVIPKFGDSSIRSRESSLKTNLKIVRNAVDLFKNDTGAFPAQLADLASVSAPTSGKDSAGASKTIVASRYMGPYVGDIPKDAVGGADMNYSVASGSVGKVTSSASGNDTAGKPYSSY